MIKFGFRGTIAKSTSESKTSLAMTSSQSIAVSVLFGFGLGLVSVAWADPASDACAALASARTALYSMINAKDKSAQDALTRKCKRQAPSWIRCLLA
jgi:hypothetical protein